MQGVVGFDRHPLEWKFQACGVSKAKMPYVGRVVTTSVVTE